jgi:hypothetical protein
MKTNLLDRLKALGAIPCDECASLEFPEDMTADGDFVFCESCTEIHEGMVRCELRQKQRDYRKATGV